jgi:hypothetical protein
MDPVKWDTAMWILRFALLSMAASAAMQSPAVARKALPYFIDNPIPPRLQWNENWGYCGEVSLISAGLYYGQYISQYDARALASPGVDQSQYSSQLLLGVNDQVAAASMHLNAVEWNTQAETSTQEFVAWLKKNVTAGYPVAIGVFVNEYLFYGNSNPQAGSSTYDHIVPVTGIASHHPLANGRYHPSDTVTFNDNGEWSNNGAPPYVFTYKAGPFQNDRAGANAPTGAIYSLPDTGRNYGIAVTGVMDTYHDTMPVQVATSVNDEEPEIQNGSNARPAPNPVTLTVTVSGLTPGVAYTLYRYTSFDAVPNDHFNANAGNAYESWPITIGSGSSAFVTETIMSDEMGIYRAVPVSAP